MKNKLSALLILATFLFVVLGCSTFTNTIQNSVAGSNSNTSNSNQSAVDKSIENVADGETSGVQECDDFIRFLKEQNEKPDDNWMTKGIKDYIIGQFKKALRESIEQNKNDKVKMAEQCVEMKKSFEKQLNAEKDKEKQEQK